MSKNINKKNQKLDEKFIPLSEAAKRSGYTPEHLNLSARKGKLPAQKIGRNWYTTEEWLDAFLNLTLEKKNGEKNISIAAEVEKVSPEEKNAAQEIAKQEKDVATIIEEISSSHSDAEKRLIKKIFPKNWLQALAGVSVIVIIAPVIFFLVYSAKYYTAQKNNEAKKIALINQSPSGSIVNENEDEIFSENAEEKILGIVRGEETTADTEAEKKSGVVLASENFKASNVSMGVGIVLGSDEENTSLEISDIKSESFITGKKNANSQEEEVKMVVSWKTNKSAMSELNFSKNNGQDKKVLKEQSFGFNHAVVLAQIDPRTSYVYQIKSKDHWGSEVTSDFYGIFTASKPVSVFDLISNQINEIFGWAIK